jgi:hypothetical protein
MYNAIPIERRESRVSLLIKMIISGSIPKKRKTLKNDINDSECCGSARIFEPKLLLVSKTGNLRKLRLSKI